MRYSEYYLLTICLFNCSILFGQASNSNEVPLVSRLGAIPVAYQITSLGESLEPVDQYLVKRGTMKNLREANGSGAGGYESWHLCITAKQPIRRPSDRSDLTGDRQYRVEYYDAEDALIGTRYLEWSDFKLTSESSELIYYELNMRTTPILVLQNARRIDLARRKPLR
ncbi:MAG: hypothetical protein AAGF87_02175 [Bacteroidota bacterium]